MYSLEGVFKPKIENDSLNGINHYDGFRIVNLAHQKI
jgi:hypothetical protein